jgi:calcineurin-like phosphoesterase family protein
MRHGPLKTTFLAATFAYAVAAGAQGVGSSGIVFVDANANGAHDPGERGLAGVAVSNQDAVVTTDASGAFRIPRGGYGVVFVSVPDGYRAVGPFWRSVGDSAAGLAFPLTPVARTREFTFVHSSDTHVAPANVERTRRLGALVDSLAPAFVLITGDLVRDALRVPETEATGYYELFAREIGAFRTPVWTVPGNHENFGIERHLSLVSPKHPLYGRRMYRHYRGPDYYSFTYGGVHFVGLNTVDIDDLWYYGHVDSLQLAWLERDLALVPPEMPVVTFDHIPFVTTIEGLDGYRDTPPAPTLITVKGRTVFRHTVSNAAEVLAVLRKRRHVLALGGHLHAAERVEYEIDGLRTRFHLSAAVVAPSEVAGLRFPSGITLYTVRGGEIDGGRFVPLGVAETRP